MVKSSTQAIRFLQSLAIPEGPKAGELIKLAPFQKKFVTGALAEDEQELFTARRSPRLEIEYDGDGGGRMLTVNL